MQEVITKFEQKYRKAELVKVQSGDSVRVSQTIREAGKEREQLFEGTVIRTRRLGSLSAAITVRKISSGVGVEKTFLLHSPNVTKVQVIRRSKVRRKFLSYIRERQGKAMRLQEKEFESASVNVKDEPKVEKSETSKQESAEDKAEAKAEEPSKKDKAAETKVEEKTPDSKEEKAEKVDAPSPKTADAQSKVADKKAKAEEFRKSQESQK